MQDLTKSVENVLSILLAKKRILCQSTRMFKIQHGSGTQSGIVLADTGRKTNLSHVVQQWNVVMMLVQFRPLMLHVVLHRLSACWGLSHAVCLR